MYRLPNSKLIVNIECRAEPGTFLRAVTDAGILPRKVYLDVSRRESQASMRYAKFPVRRFVIMAGGRSDLFPGGSRTSRIHPCAEYVGSAFQIDPLLSAFFCLLWFVLFVPCSYRLIPAFPCFFFAFSPCYSSLVY